MTASALKMQNNTSISLLHIKICISFLEKLLKKNSRFTLPLLLCCLLYHGVSGVGSVSEVSVKEGSSVSLHTGVETNQQDRLRWYLYDTRIAEITGDFSKICTDVQCNEGTERFRDRLKLDHQTGSLTIMNTRTTDSGDYLLQISSGNSSNSEKAYSVTVRGFFSVNTDGVSVFVMERDSVTFQTDVKTNQQGRIRWYFNDIRIAQITGDLRKICTDVQCNNYTESFRDRLKLDKQTGSLSITNIRTTDAGLFQLRISSTNNGEGDKTFSFAVHDISAAEQDEIKKKEGENVTLYSGEISQNDLLRWYFNDTLIVEITGDQSKICADDQCEDRFRDRLKLDHQTGSLTITNTRTTDSGVYQQQIYSSRISIIRSFTVSVTVAAVRDPGPPSTAAPGTNAAVIGGAVGGVLLVAAVAVVIYCCHKECTKTKQNDTRGQNNHNEENGAAENLLSGENGIEMNVVKGTTTDQAVANGTS
ncbi:uncharacterized protein LOC107690501 [Sinocyclocheilus anshuiensis]|uniref:uncharacterized protein LOC107690501 n=1 Tax=Sinocyclocheilus anshuiensis TaxID=1608454 RepID=UPI0007B7AB8A|nr:PREDICTED: uncharacterized protein LOC107690501 [Sinocyclocheilus anshuiensis]